MLQTDVDRLVRELINSPRNRCFVCSQTNHVGLHLRFERAGQMVRTRFVPGEWHEGWQGVVHGGILAAVLDETMAYTIFFSGVKGVTAKMEIRYRAPIRQGDVLDVEAKITKDTRRLVDVACRIVREGQVVVEASGRFIKLGVLNLDTIG